METAEKELVELKPEEPKMLVIQVDLSPRVGLCFSAAEEVAEELNSYSAIPLGFVALSIALLQGRHGFLDMSKPMTMDIAQRKFADAVVTALNARLHCKCGREFKLRLVSNE